MLLQIATSLLLLTTGISAGNNCDCGLFVSNEFWLPKVQVLTTSNNYALNCTDFGVATNKCKDLCRDEMAAMRTLFHKGSFFQSSYLPSQEIGCDASIRSTITFSRACGSQNYVLSSTDYGPAICCDQKTSQNHWCSYEILSQFGYEEQENVVESRKLDLANSEDDISNNEIEGSTKPIKHKVGSQTVSEDSSWVQAMLKFFGYKSFTEMIKNIDIFSIPGKVQKATKTYKDELSMGRCYMEFTTFKVFTKNESPLTGLIRRRRDVDENDEVEEDLTTVEEILSAPLEADDVEGRNLKDVMSQLFSQYGGTEGRQYANLMNIAMKVLPQLLNSQNNGGSSSASGPAMLFNMLQPVFSQMTKARPTPVQQNQADRFDNRPPQNPNSSSPQPNPMASIAMNLLSSAVQNYFQGSQSSNKSPPPRPTTEKPQPPHQTNMASSTLGSLMNMFFQGMGRPAEQRPVRPITKRPKPKPAPLRNRPSRPLEEKQDKSFVDKLIDLIRPVFISIFGNTPGESGVKAIRRVSTLSTLGRVDNTLKEEVDSPYFCLKRYAVNKAWTVTETGVRTLVKKFTPEEKERMAKMLF